MRIVFIRHGETTGDLENRYGGDYDDVLSPAGEEQVVELAQELVDKGIEQIFVSPLIRAQQTAQGLGIKNITTIPELKERNQYGKLSGMVKAEAALKHPDWIDLLKDKNNTIPHAERYIDSIQRMQQGYQQVLEQIKNVSAVVWHGGCMRALFREILKIGELSKVGDCAWVEVEFDRDGAAKIVEMRRIERADD